MTRAPPPPPPGVQFSARAELPAPDARVTGPEDARLSPLAPCRGPAAASRPPSGCPAFCLPVCLAHGHAAVAAWGYRELRCVDARAAGFAWTDGSHFSGKITSEGPPGHVPARLHHFTIPPTP